MATPSINSLQREYEKLMKQSHKLSTRNRAESDKLFAEANAIAEQINELKKAS